ncbi:hypothetical protein PDK09_27135, partial [Bacillus cereus]|nr:hypothetical protein [Bacillus cereus]MDA1769608.1 hypothetical protein [Bacillus cereus]
FTGSVCSKSKTMYSSIIWINSVNNEGSSRNPHYFLGTYPFFAPELKMNIYPNQMNENTERIF